MTDSSMPPATGSSEPMTDSSMPPATGSSPPMTDSSMPPATGSSQPMTGSTMPPATGSSSVSTGPTGGPTLSTGLTSPGSSSGASAVPTSAGTTLSPEDTISKANSVITQANAAHAVATENANTASEASSAVDDIQASLSARIKRQAASTTVGPVSGCADFGTKYDQRLTELSNFSDNNAGLIKQLVTVLKNVGTIPCTASEKSDLKASTETKVAAAKSKATAYKAEKEAEKEELVKKVQQAQADISQANQDLINANKPTVAV